MSKHRTKSLTDVTPLGKSVPQMPGAVEVPTFETDDTSIHLAWVAQHPARRMLRVWWKDRGEWFTAEVAFKRVNKNPTLRGQKR